MSDLRRAELVKEAIALSNKLNALDRNLGATVYCVAINLRNGGDIFNQVKELGEQVELANQLAGFLSAPE